MNIELVWGRSKQVIIKSNPPVGGNKNKIKYE
jgi:hypothetical protein